MSTVWPRCRSGARRIEARLDAQRLAAREFLYSSLSTRTSLAALQLAQLLFGFHLVLQFAVRSTLRAQRVVIRGTTREWQRPWVDVTAAIF